MKIPISREQPFPPGIRRACVKFLEYGLGDVVSRNLQCLVNKLCKTATTAITLSFDPAPREISGNLPGSAGWQLFKIGVRLPTETFSLPFGTL